MFSHKLEKGAMNLLLNCANLKANEKLLVVIEDEKLGWYKNDLYEAVLYYAKKLGVVTQYIFVGLPSEEASAYVKERMIDQNCVIYLSRLGDQGRFDSAVGCRSVMSYIRDATALASRFGTTPYGAHLELKNILDSIFSMSNDFLVTCPKGTNLSGSMSKVVIDEPKEVQIKRFPMVVHRPISAKLFNGKVVISEFLTSTGSNLYSPAFIKLDSEVQFILKSGSIEQILGQRRDVKKVEAHYALVSQKFKINAKSVHSWHSGIHEGFEPKKFLSIDPDHWANSVFVSPQYLHFHTCGDYAPGEICLMIENPTIRIDDILIWDHGSINYQASQYLRKWVSKWSRVLG